MGNVNEIVHIWSYLDTADPTKRRAAMAADPAWQSCLQKSREVLEDDEQQDIGANLLLTHEVREKHVDDTPAPRSGAQVLIDQLRIHGADTIFGVPGESYLAALDALYAQRNSIRFIICRQEGGAANMAEAYGKLTGKPGIAFVTRGPGATNASIGLHTGFQDSTPMILLVGQVARETTDREAFQEIDYRHMFGPMAKWVTQIEDARRIPELISQAFHRALNGRPGAGRRGAARRHADRRGSRWPMPAPTRSRAARRRLTTWRSCAPCSKPPNGRW